METDRLILRHFCEDDSADCYANFGKEENLGQFIAIFPIKDSNEMKKWIREWSANLHMWAVVEKRTLQPIGYITVDIPYPQLQIGEIGYVIGEKFQHSGYASEAVSCILNEYFINQHLYLIEAKYNEINTASSRLLQRLGFQRECSLRDRRMDQQTNKRTNLCICSITQEEYRKKQGNNELAAQ